jgi:putative MFS transporter
VLLHLPFYFKASDENYVLAGKSPDAPFMVGMLLILAGLAATGYGLFPRLSEVSRGYVSRIKVRALDDAPIKASHVGLLLVMAAAITIDVMKPTTLAFIAVAVCGAMPEYWMNLVVCFIMGLGVGGMLPITFALMAETIPARHRGWLMVLIGGDVAGAYIITSWIASTIAAPDAFGWRMLWLISLPTGLILIVLNRWIPESPRFLLQHGREEEARSIMERYGAVVVESDDSMLRVERHVKSRFATLFSGPFFGLSLVVLLLGLGIGMVQFGFQQWIPSNLQKLGLKEVTASKILRDSALIGFPLNFPIAWLYGYWSGKKTILLMAATTAAALIGFLVVPASSLVHDGQSTTLLYILLIVPIWGISSLTAVMVAYASEIYPTKIRSRGTGLAAGATKFGGVTILATVAAAIAAPSIRSTALIGVIPIILAIVALIVFGVETKKKQLERITAEELHETMTV